MHRHPGRDPLEPHHAPHHAPHGHSHAHGRNDAPAQWQTPHLPEGHEPPKPDEARDLDLVEQAFVEGFAAASDPTSFLRLSGVPFEGVDGEGKRLSLLRVEQDQATDVGSITPQLGGGGFRYAPLPARLASRRSRLRFVYFDGSSSRSLSFEEARALGPAE